MLQYQEQLSSEIQQFLHLHQQQQQQEEQMKKYGKGKDRKDFATPSRSSADICVLQSIMHGEG
ncbi:hypothetical protein DM02DRAFT_649531 [Periconia macrospinosa]|uniref:Uncharacterized protein n=1 Tax=Periconia macrospinosa TaxID=97972 RepID=A0A2V1EAW7_9PLEO|nr:hypothetical protein DM02DRAFT_649531 [Periconia macrospinosa]